MGASSTLSLPVTQGKPSLRRIKGRIHRSKSLDSIDLLDSNVSTATGGLEVLLCEGPPGNAQPSVQISVLSVRYTAGFIPVF